MKQLKQDLPEGLPQADNQGKIYLNVIQEMKEPEVQEEEEVLATQS